MSANCRRPPLTAADVELARAVPGRSVLLFATDRCPVGCAHCSVDSRRDSPRVTDFALFRELIAGLALIPELQVVGISGGEPFTERRALTLAARELADAGKRLVIYTSGVWARSAESPAWIAAVLSRASCVYLSTDAYHAARVSEGSFVRAARASSRAGAWIVTQVAGRQADADAAQSLLSAAFGRSWPDHAEIRSVPVLPYGRAAGWSGEPPRPGRAFGRCALAAAPVVRYDGWVSACCNEAVVMGGGPRVLRRLVLTRAELRAALTAFASDAYLGAITTSGLGRLTELPAYRDLASRPFPHICSLCWEMSPRSLTGSDAVVLTLLSQRAPA